MAQYFNLTLDTTAPGSGVLSGLQNYYKTNATVTISAEGASFMKVWVDQKATGLAADAPSSWEAYNTSKTVSFSTQGTNYVHALFMDEVGNIGPVVNSSAVVYDTVAPTVSAVSINSGAGYTKNTSNTVRVTFSDATSGVSTITLSGDIAASEKKTYTLTDADRTAGYKDFTITFATPDGTKTVTAVATDFSGNTSTSNSDTIVYDSTSATITPILRTADDTANLPAYVNTKDYGVRIVTEASDITHYKVWEGNSEPSTWTAISNATVVTGEGYFIDDLELSSSEGEKTIHVKVQDIAGNVTEGSALTVTLDTVAPIVTLSSDVSMISAQTGFNTVVFTCGATDTNSAQGLTYELKLGNTVIKSGTFASSVTVTQAEINAISSGQGQKAFKLYVTDVAGNTGESNEIVVTVDLAAPVVIVGVGDSNTGTVRVTIQRDTAHDRPAYAPMDGIKIWYDSNSEPTNWTTMTVDEFQGFDISNVPEGVHQFHYKVKDSVNNITSGDVSYETLVDMTPPTGTISTNAYTNSRNITVNLTIADAILNFTTGLDTYSAYMKVWENGTTEPSEWEDFANTKSLVLSTGDGTKVINVKFKDGLDNESSTVAATCSTVLDTDEPDVTLTLVKGARVGTVLPAKVNVRNFDARIGFTNETQDSPIVEYKLVGDFVQSSDTWQTFSPDSGKSYMSIETLTFTESEGLKTVTAYLRDAAGNISASPASVTVTYDISAPVIDVNAPDYNIVSKQHTNRLNASGTVITGKYNDMCTFTWSANENLQAFKVCVNEVGQTAASATAIGTDHGSQNMNGSAVEANTDITSVIFGADFAATDAVNDTDGAYEIIVYGKDEAGTWSAVHVLS